jgi:conjugal transfer pilus assembly protein TraW
MVRPVKSSTLVLAILCVFGCQIAAAESLGVYGRTYPIIERDAIVAMKEAVAKKLANGGKEKMMKDAKDRYMASLNNVVTPAGITPARANATHFVDLTETIKETITDTQGSVVVLAGTRVNPLVLSPLPEKLFFIDAKDIRQLQLVASQAEANDKIILLGGSVFKAGEYLKRRVYLDIPGFHKRMQINKLPSIVSQEGDKLKIREVLF